jgi:hypothetical protein
MTVRLGTPIHGHSRPFSRPIMPRYPLGSFGAMPLASFGDGPCRRSIDTFRDSTHHNGSMGSFGQTVSRAIWPFSRPIMPRYPLGSFGATPLASFGKTASQTQLASFGDGPCRRGIDTFRDSTHHNGSMGSFGEDDSRAVLPVFSTHHAEIPIGFVWRRGKAIGLRVRIELTKSGATREGRPQQTLSRKTRSRFRNS